MHGTEFTSHLIDGHDGHDGHDGQYGAHVQESFDEIFANWIPSFESVRENCEVSHLRFSPGSRIPGYFTYSSRLSRLRRWIPDQVRNDR